MGGKRGKSCDRQADRPLTICSPTLSGERGALSAIVGIFYCDGRPVEPRDLGAMSKALAHRGPDGTGAWHEGPVGLAHRMLRTTPESFHERLPIINGTGDLVLTADARLDNRDELISTLGLSD